MTPKTTIESLEFSELSFKTETQKIIIDNQSLKVPMGKIVWVQGPTSSGKTVFIRLLGGLMMPTSGRYLINNEIVNEMTFEEFLKFRMNIGYSFDFGGLINNRTLFQNLSLPLQYHNFGSEEEIKKEVQLYMDIFDLNDVSYERPSSVAGGYRKAICVARAFMLRPELLLLDDPTTGLRGAGKENLKKLILDNYKNGINKHIFVATEDEAFMQSLGAEVIVLNNGKISSQLFDSIKEAA
jgi:phospholipid/cholesterol/gamma-HCH transport system ATP-binding protein